MSFEKVSREFRRSFDRTWGTRSACGMAFAIGVFLLLYIIMCPSNYYDNSDVLHNPDMSWHLKGFLESVGVVLTCLEICVKCRVWKMHYFNNALNNMINKKSS